MRLSLTTAETGYGKIPAGAKHLNAFRGEVCESAHGSAVEGAICRHWGGEPPRPEMDKSVVAHAIVRQSRWVVMCPWCPSASFASTEDRRFFCLDCGNASVKGRWVKVEWPKQPEEIELHLSVRSDPHTRNWERGESLGDLAVENAEHGVSGLVLAR